MVLKTGDFCHQNCVFFEKWTFSQNPNISKPGDRLSMAAAMAMFYHEVMTDEHLYQKTLSSSAISPSPQPTNDDLRVIAVQLGQHPGPDCPVEKTLKRRQL